MSKNLLKVLFVSVSITLCGYTSAKAVDDCDEPGLWVPRDQESYDGEVFFYDDGSNVIGGSEWDGTYYLAYPHPNSSKGCGFYLPCPYGEVTDDIMDTECHIPECGEGEYGDGYTCDVCPDNYDNDATGMTDIDECCLNGYDPDADMCIEECGEGEEWHDGEGCGAIECGEGEYGDGETCDVCPDNYDNDATGMTDIEECCLNGYDPDAEMCMEECGDGEVWANGGCVELYNSTIENQCNIDFLDGDGEIAANSFEAVYDANAFNVAYNAGTGTGSKSTTTCTYDSSCTTPSYSGFSKRGYDFTTWNLSCGNTATDCSAKTGLSVGASIKNATAINNATVTLTANWAPHTYTVSAGNYLAQNGISGTTCPANSYCSGGSYSFSETSDQGKTSCPTNYPLSTTGASTINTCYQNCSVDCIQPTAPEHSVNVVYGTETGTGKTYYESTCDAVAPTCSITSFGCETGYHYKAEVITPLKGKEKFSADSKPYGSSKLNGVAGYRETAYGLTPGSGEWAAEFSHGTIKGEALCSTQSGIGAFNGASNASQVSTADSLTPETGTGQYCWCKITGYTPSGSSTLQSWSSPWVFHNDLGGAGNCAGHCADYCAIFVRYAGSDYLVFRSALFGSSPAACVANEINVNWYNGDTLYETNTCTYDGDITLPTAPTKTGYEFSGWKLVTGSSN